jgi:hypothetical protein
MATPRRRVRVTEPDWLSGPEVAERLSVHLTTVHRIPAEQLPYEATPGGLHRAGRRRYRPEDVERYATKLAADIKARIAATEDRLTAIERRLDRHEQGHDDSRF